MHVYLRDSQGLSHPVLECPLLPTHEAPWMAASFLPASLQGLALAEAGDSTQPLPKAPLRELSHTHLAPARKHTLILSLKRLPRFCRLATPLT